MCGETTSVLVSIAKYTKQAVVDDENFIGMVFLAAIHSNNKPLPKSRQ